MRSARISLADDAISSERSCPSSAEGKCLSRIIETRDSECCDASGLCPVLFLLKSTLVPSLAVYPFPTARWPAFPAPTMVRSFPTAPRVNTADTNLSARSHCRDRRHWHSVPARLPSCCDARRRHTMGQALVAHQHPAPPFPLHRQGCSRCLPFASRPLP